MASVSEHGCASGSKRYKVSRPATLCTSSSHFQSPSSESQALIPCDVCHKLYPFEEFQQHVVEHLQHPSSYLDVEIVDVDTTAPVETPIAWSIDDDEVVAEASSPSPTPQAWLVDEEVLSLPPLPADATGFHAAGEVPEIPSEHQADVAKLGHTEPDASGGLLGSTDDVVCLEDEYEDVSHQSMMTECCICRSEVDKSFMYSVPCGSSHEFCLGCLYTYVKSEVYEHGRKPCCPSGDCQFHLQQDNIEDIVVPMGKENEAERIIMIIGNLDKRALGCISCPKCGMWLSLPDAITGNVLCGCLYRFCTECYQPAHFQVSCEDAARHVERYALWLREGRRAFVETRAEESDHLRRYEAARASHEKRAKEIEGRQKEYQEMESWKAKHCKECPHCNRVVQKIDGCDSMVCGQDAHGGNDQSGCGKKFYWGRAKKYTPKVAEVGPVLEEFDLSRPPEAKVYEIEPGLPLPCDVCNTQIKGIRFRCITCPSFECCLDCEINLSADFDRARHSAHTHIFQIIQ